MSELREPKEWKHPGQHIILLDEVPERVVGRNAWQTVWVDSYRTNHMGEAVLFMSALAASNVQHHAVVQFEPERGYHVRMQVKEVESEVPI